MQVHDLALARVMSRQPKLEMLRYVPHLLASVGSHMKGKVPSLLMVASTMGTWIEQSPDPFSQKNDISLYKTAQRLAMQKKIDVALNF